MSTIRIDRASACTAVPNEIVNDPTLSIKAKGLMLILLSVPADCNYELEPLIALSTDGKAAFYSGLTELKNAGYIRKYPIYENGKISRWQTVVYDVKQAEIISDEAENLDIENQEVETTAPIADPSEDEFLFIENQEIENPYIDQKRKPRKREPKSKVVKLQYAEYVMMRPEDYTTLVEKYGEQGAQWMITMLDNHKGASGKEYKDDYRAILKWVVDEYERKGRQTITSLHQTAKTSLQSENIFERMKRQADERRAAEHVVSAVGADDYNIREG